ncbi:LOG family protein [Chelatococcus sp. SYSU_G07232]|uniref:AMP nucleosidase n=1 Tax=Chelatococcus albus TaxID=3047466 RepID=A0ABT7AL88_9HYPH|nr:LOG family protein [Chelatococcus sp. SYSU_G07232]MDJ1160143.1 LOG family protein [Chelatococcus sp. SYSU_G07232]
MDDRDNTAQKTSRSYSLPALDQEFLLGDSMRGVRFLLEYAKAEEHLRHWGIRSTIVVFGSARVRPLGAGPYPDDAADDPRAAERRAREARWYEEARRFARIASERGGALNHNHDGTRENVIATGGGPGIMEAANRGAWEAGAPSIGFNITLPHEQEPNPYSTPELTFRFHYFAMRKMHLAMRAAALVVFPGGFGTLDELFELLTLQQTGKAPDLPVVLFDKAYWTRIIDFEALAEAGMIAPRDLALFAFADEAEEAWASLIAQGLRMPAT